MIGDGCLHGNSSLNCPHCTRLGGESQYNPWDVTKPIRKFGQDLYRDDYRYAPQPASSVDINRLERNVARLNDEVRRLGLLVTKLISIFAPGEPIS